MKEHEINKFISLIQQNNYEIRSENYTTDTFVKSFIIKTKCFLVPSLVISFSYISCSKGEDLLTQVEELNKHINNNKPLIILLILSMDLELKDNFWFNGNVLVHMVVHNEKLNSLSYEKDFHYFGAKKVRKLIDLLKNALDIME